MRAGRLLPVLSRNSPTLPAYFPMLFTTISVREEEPVFGLALRLLECFFAALVHAVLASLVSVKVRTWPRPFRSLARR